MTTTQALADGDVAALRRLLWAPHAPAQDVARWLQQGFVFQPPLAAFALGLVQGHGGPCGVLAAVQAELLRLALFPERATTAPSELLAERVDEAAQHEWLVRALASLLVLCRGQAKTVRVVKLREPPADGADVADLALDETALENVASASDPALLALCRDRLEAWRSPLGVVLFVFSVLRTKTVAAVKDEMDDPDSALTGQFGHCSQELLNLLLTGAATSNVFDGVVPMGDTGLMLRGIQQRPRLGYLTQLEALRYCQVGNYYKSPQFPVWVIGSSSHFSVCFGLDLELCEASASAMLFQRMQRVFKAFDPMEAGFMEIGSLPESLRQLGVSSDILESDFYMAQLCSRLEVSGAGIILWDEYWRLVSVLVHTNDVELTLSGSYRSDGGNQASGKPRPKTDEEIARELQAQFDAEDGGANPPPVTTPPTNIGSAPTASHVDARQQFELYYYNGLSKRDRASSELLYPELRKTIVTVERLREFIGDAIPIELSTSMGDGGHTGPPLESILKTKWSAASFNWEGSNVPSVD